MKIALAIALVPVYFVVLSVGPADVPSTEVEALFSAIVTVLFSLAFLRLSGVQWWIPPVIVALVYFVGGYPIASVTGYVIASPDVKGNWAVVLGNSQLLRALVPITAACIASWFFRKTCVAV